MSDPTWAPANFNWIPAVDHICPRCLGPVPGRDAAPGAYPGALSRADNAHEICSGCGVDEAVGRGPIAPTFWPLTDQG